MFVGHFAVALGARHFTPDVSLGTLFLACQLADLIWPDFLLLGLETVAIVPGITVLAPFDFIHYPYSHSLVALTLWGGLFAGVHALLRRTTKKTAAIIALLVISHWILDFVTHRPDMPISLAGSSRFGLGLWNHPLVAIPLELSLFAAGVWIYVGQTVATNRTGRIAFWGLVLFLLVAYAANLLGPPPPSVTALAWSAQSLWILVAWAFWVDRNRRLVKS